MAQDVQTDLEAALEKAAASETETEESSTEEEVEETEAKATEKKEEVSESKGKSHKGANDRIQDLLGNAKDLEKQIEDLTGTVGSRDEEIGKLVDLLKARDNDAAVVQKINELHQTNPDMRDLIETLDKALKGEEVELPGKGKEGESEEKPEAIAKAQELIKEAKAGLDEQLAAQSDELILHKADLLTDNYVSELPEEYNDEDKFILRSVLVDHIPWDKIESDNAVLPEAFAGGFQSALDWYGTPKGTKAAVPEGEESKSQQGAKPLTEESLGDFVGQEWGKLKTVTTPDGETVQPEISDEDFTASLAQAMKAGNKLGG